MFNTKDKGMKRTYAIGIDPGQTGAIAIFQLDEGEYYLNSIFDYADKYCWRMQYPYFRPVKK